MNRLEIIRGASASWTFRGMPRVGASTPEGFGFADPIAAELWAGDDRATTFAPAVAWVDAEACTFRVSIVGAQSAQLEPSAGYQVYVYATAAGERIPLARAALTVQGSPGSADGPKVYCTTEDLEAACGWLPTLTNLAADQAGFARQRGEAREWLDALILAAYRPIGQSSHLYGGLGYGGALQADPTMIAALAADGLVLTGPRGRKAVAACAAYAVHLVLRGSGDKDLRADGAAFKRSARAKVANLIVDVDTNADGVVDVSLALGTSNTLRG